MKFKREKKHFKKKYLLNKWIQRRNFKVVFVSFFECLAVFLMGKFYYCAELNSSMRRAYNLSHKIVEIRQHVQTRAKCQLTLKR